MIVKNKKLVKAVNTAVTLFTISVILVACSGGNPQGTPDANGNPTGRTTGGSGGTGGTGGSGGGSLNSTLFADSGSLAQFTAYAPITLLKTNEVSGAISDPNFKPLIKSGVATPSTTSSLYTQYFNDKNSKNPLWATQGNRNYPAVSTLKTANGYTFVASPLSVQEIAQNGGIFPPITGKITDFAKAIQSELDGTQPQAPFTPNILNPYFQAISPQISAFVKTTLSPIVAKGWAKANLSSSGTSWVYVVYSDNGIRMPAYNKHPSNGSSHPLAGQFDQAVLIPGFIPVSQIAGYVEVTAGNFGPGIYLSDKLNATDKNAFDLVYNQLSGESYAFDYDEMVTDAEIPRLIYDKQLGGSTGGQEFIDPLTHFRYVKKDIRNNPNYVAGNPSHPTNRGLIDHADRGALADQLYRLMGALAPISRLVSNPTTYEGVYFSLFFYGKNIAFNAGPSAQSIAHYKKHYAVDALVANTDITKNDNAWSDRFERAWRLDNGSAFEFRAQGLYKGSLKGHKLTTPYDEFPIEVFSLLIADRNAHANGHFQGLSYRDIVNQMRSVIAKRTEILNLIGARNALSPHTLAAAQRIAPGIAPSLATVVGARIDKMQYLVDAFDSLIVNKTVDQISNCCAFILEAVRFETTQAVPLPIRPRTYTIPNRTQPQVLALPAVAGGALEAQCTAWGW